MHRYDKPNARAPSGADEPGRTASPDHPRARAPESLEPVTVGDLGMLLRHLEPQTVQVFVLDADFRFSYLPDDIERVLGYSAAELLGFCIWERFPELQGSRLETVCREVAQSRAGQMLECRVAHLHQWVKVAITWTPAGIMVQFHDITGRVFASEQLQSRESMLQAVFDALPMWLSVKNADFRYLMVNRRTLADTGLSELDFYHTHTLDLPLGHREELAEVFKLDQMAVQAGGTVISPDLVHTLADGSERTYRHYKAPFLGPDGEAAGVVTVSEDVTAFNRMVEDLAASRQSLQMAQELARMGSWEWELDTGSVVWSAGMHVLLQSDPQAVAPSYERLLECIHPDDRERVVGVLDAAVSDKTAFDIEHRLLIADDQDGQGRSVRFVRHRAMVNADSPLATGRILGTLLDISDYKRVEQELRRNSARLARSNLDLEAFAAVASHDLQEPLRKIMAFGERLSQAVGDTLHPDAQGNLQRILDSTQRMRQLIDDLLRYSRVASRGRPFAETDLNRVLEEVRQALGSKIAEHGAQVDIGPLPMVWADAIQLHQVFRELIGNALQFARSGVVPHVRISAGPLVPGPENPAPELCILTVADNGVGFEQKFAERIFGVFKRLYGRGSPYQGTGIGLALCRKVVDRHGGVISARSAVGEGTEITLKLPASPLTERESA